MSVAPWFNFYFRCLLLKLSNLLSFPNLFSSLSSSFLDNRHIGRTPSLPSSQDNRHVCRTLGQPSYFRLFTLYPPQGFQDNRHIGRTLPGSTLFLPFLLLFNLHMLSIFSRILF